MDYDWRAIEREADKLLPDIPRIEFGTFIQSTVSVDLRSTRRFDTSNVVHVKSIAPNLERVRRIEKRLVNLEKAINPRMPAALNDKPIVYVKPKDYLLKGPCERCGKPCSGHYCVACYRLNAVDRRERLLEERDAKIARKKKYFEDKKKILEQKRAMIIDRKVVTKTLRQKTQEELNIIESAIEGYSYWLDIFSQCTPKEMAAFDGDFWLSPIAEQKMKSGEVLVLNRVTEDFTIELINVIEAAEVAIGKPLAKWESHEEYCSLFATKENRKRIVYSNDAATRMHL